MNNNKFPRTPFSTPLSGSARETEIRLKHIFSGPKKRPPALFLALIFSMCIFCGNLVSFQAQAAEPERLIAPVSGQAGSSLTVRILDRFKSLILSLQKDPKPDQTSSTDAERYYEAGSLPLFQLEFSRLDKEAQSQWLDRIYADGDIAFMGAAVTLLEDDCAPILRLAETIYQDGDLAFFSTLAMHMSENTLEQWLDRALEDGNWAFQSMLYNKLDRNDEFDALKEAQEKEWEKAMIAEYGAVGVTVDGKNYYYQGQLVNVFLDIRSNKSFYTLNMNPKGTVNIKITRNANNNITGVAYLTEAEVRELFGDMADNDPEVIPVQFKTAAAGEPIDLGEFTLYKGDSIHYDVSAETGSGMRVFFARAEEKDVAYWSVSNLRQPGEPLQCAADFTVGPPAKPGTYHLYLQALNSPLGNVTGSISITPAEL